ncbi:MAG: lipid-A-disaccharide synthase [Flavobacteriales bacterium]|nr:lipid-A-disaccharide synthase [Flavobacteriales bacterium]MCB9365115.1 lipid-A-disaccharide synthase [Flavobacteriales bacterium]
MKYYIIAGEASGDLHASNLIKELKNTDTNAEFRCWGGDLMQAQGATIVKHYRDLAFMGFAEVLMNIRTIFKNLAFCKEDIKQYQPDVIIFIDYPGFNLKIAEWAKAENFKTFYYISPQIWAWKQNRVHKIKKCIDKMFVILPFEKGFYKKFDMDVDFVGHPLLDAIVNRNKLPFETFCSENGLSKKPIIALLPGSRKQEISKMLPILLSITNKFTEYQFVIAGAPSQDKSVYETFLDKNVSIIENKTYQLLEQSSAALVTSGTATLETALFNVPQVVCYKGNKISFLIAKAIVKVKYISLVNLIMDNEVVTELIQDKLTTKNLVKELEKLLNPDNNSVITQKYTDLQTKLGGNGASRRTAQLMTQYLTN